MIDRYSRPHLKAIWEPARKYETWLKVELLACEALAKKGLIPPSAVKQIQTKARIKPARIEALERVTKHDVIAFLESISEQVGPAARYLHMGLTSSDILDTSLAVLMVEAADAILGELDRLLAVLRTRALEHRDTLMIGRSHGIHGEPITFGIKLAIWYDEATRHRERVDAAREGIAYGKVSGAMGTFAHLSPDVEAYVCKKLGLKPAPASSQIIQRDRHAAYLTALALLASFTDLMADLVVYPDRMRRNLELTGGIIYSQRLMLELVRQGAPRVQAYEAVQRLAMAAWEGRTPFRDLVEKDPFITRHLSDKAIGMCFDAEAYTRHVPEVFKRVFGSSGRARAPRTRGKA